MFHDFCVTEQEYDELDGEYGRLCEWQAWSLIRKNSRNNHTDDQQDIAQEIRTALLIAGSYYKRQIYIERCLSLCQKYANRGSLIESIVGELDMLWQNKTHHGANRRKFGPHQEKILDRLTKQLVPAKERPQKTAKLKIDSKFARYAKSITWNRLKALGKKITREKTIRTGQVSLSEFDYLGSSG